MLLTFLNIAIIAGIIAWGYHSNTGSAISKFFIPAALIKIIAGLGVGLVYSKYYSGGDTWVLFDNAVRLGESAFSRHNFTDIYIAGDYSDIQNFMYTIEPRSAFVCKLIALINLLTDRNYWLTSVYFSLFSFFGMWYLASSLCFLYKRVFTVTVAFLFFPSVVFWSSGILKETLLMGAFGFFIGVLLRIYFSKVLRYWEYFAAIISFLLIFFVKYYYAGIIIGITLSAALTYKSGKPFKNWKFDAVLWLVSLTLLLFLVSLFHPNLWQSRFLDVIVANNMQYTAITKSVNLINFHLLEPNWGSVLLNVPKALFAGLYLPILSSGGGVFKLIVAIENGILLLISVASLVIMKIPSNREQRILLVSAITYIVLLAIFLSLSTPSLGTLARYKVGYQPILIYLILEGVYPWRKKVFKVW